MGKAILKYTILPTRLGHPQHITRLDDNSFCCNPARDLPSTQTRSGHNADEPPRTPLQSSNLHSNSLAYHQ
jgi:hypothetical protein